jgi:hypothetical protein
MSSVERARCAELFAFLSENDWPSPFVAADLRLDVVVVGASAEEVELRFAMI